MEPIRDLDAGTLRRIDWRELFPATLLLKALGVSLRFLPIFGASIFVALTLMIACSGPVSALNGIVVQAVGGLVLIASALPFGSMVLAAVGIDPACGFSPSEVFFVPTWPRMVIIGLTGLFFALMISRAAAVRITSTERAGWIGSFRFAVRHYLSLLLAIALPLIFAALCLLPVWGISLLPLRAAQMLVPISIFCAFLAALLFLGDFLAFPMMIAAVATDRCDGFDAFSRAFSYLFRRPIHFLFYLVFGLALGVVGWALVKGIVVFVLMIVGFFAGNMTVSDGTFTGNWLGFWLILLTDAVPLAFIFVFKYTAYTALYLILRRSVDDVAFDIFAPGDDQKPHRLRPVLADAEGAPEMTENNSVEH